LTDRLRILLFNTAHRWIGEAAGTDLLARALVTRGHDVRVAMPQGGKLLSHLGSPTYEVIPLPWRERGGGLGAHLSQYRAVRNLLAELRPHIVHVGRGQEHWCVALSGASHRPCLVRTRHVVLPMRQNTANRWLFRHRTDAVTAISAAAFEGLGTLGDLLPPERRRVVAGAVDTAHYARSKRSEELRRDLGAGADTILVGLLGRWQRVKGPDVFLMAMGNLAREHPNVRAVLAGRKVTLENPKLRRYHDEAGIDGRIAYRGMVEDPAALIASMDIGVIASRGSEGFSRIAVEYMASGVPVVATRVGALPEIIRDGETGLLVPPEDAPALTHAIGRLILHPALRNSLAAQALAELTPRFAPARMAEEMEGVYRAALEAGS